MIITDDGFKKVETTDQPIKYRESINNNADNAVSKIDGKGLSTNDLTDELKSKYDGYEVKSKTYAELKSLKDSSQLKAGQHYLLTDYVTKYQQPVSNTMKVGKYDLATASPTEIQEETEPLLLMAISDNEFAVECYSSLYPDDIIYYDFDDNICENGSTPRNGFILRRYWVKNEVNVPDDWRHILWYRDDGEYGTFSDADGNITDYAYQISIGGENLSTTKRQLANNVFKDLALSLKAYNVTAGNGFYSNTFGSGCNNNTFGSDCNNNTFGSDCNNNTFGSYCYRIAFGSGCNSNTFGSDCSRNTFGSSCYRNTFGSSCYSNTFGSSCPSNTFGSNCYSNTFGSSCNYNTFGSSCFNNTFGSGYKRLQIKSGGLQGKNVSLISGLQNKNYTNTIERRQDGSYVFWYLNNSNQPVYTNIP